jgi:hypothetical protein
LQISLRKNSFFFFFFIILKLNLLKNSQITANFRVTVQGVKSLGGHFACLCREFDFYEEKKKNIHIIFQKEKGNTFTP